MQGAGPHELRVPEGEIHRLRSGQRADLRVGVGGIGPKTGVLHQAAVGHAGEHPRPPMAVGPSEIPGVDLTAGSGLEDARPIALEAFVAQARQEALVAEGGPATEAVVVLRPGPPPAAPAPAVVVDGKAIAAAAIAALAVEMVGGDRSHPGVVAVALQQLLHEGEEAGVRMDVVLQHDPFRFLLEKPADGGRHCSPAAVVGIGVAALNCDVPVEPLLHQIPATPHKLLIFGVVSFGTITSQVKPLRLQRLENGKQRVELRRPIPENEQERNGKRQETSKADRVRKSNDKMISRAKQGGNGESFVLTRTGGCPRST